jgi:hypothetical protein
VLPQRKGRKKKEHITESIFECIKEGRAICKLLYRCGRSMANIFLKTMLMCWKDHVASVNVQSATNGSTSDKQTYKVQPWHSVFGLCTCTTVKKFLQLRKRASKHRNHVNGLIKLERHMWISDKADQLDQAVISGNMHAMYSELGALTKYATNKSSSSKVCRVCDADGNPTQSYSEEKLAFREHFASTMSATVMPLADIIDKDRKECNEIGKLDRYNNI